MNAFVAADASCTRTVTGCRPKLKSSAGVREYEAPVLALGVPTDNGSVGPFDHSSPGLG